ncbi:MAG: penicillin-binding protein 2 [Patescibacteria group bacterium]
MADQPENRSLFGWDSKGLDLEVGSNEKNQFHHEILYEDELNSLSGRPVFLGPALPKRRYLIILSAILLAVSVLLARAFWMQAVQGDSYRQLAERNRLRQELLLAKRGIIKDRNGIVLADNVPSFDLHVIPWYLPKDADRRDELLVNIGREVNMTLSDIYRVIESASDPTQNILLKRDISYESAIAVQVLIGNDPSVQVVTGSKRRYTLSKDIQSLSHILGYVGPLFPEEYKEKKAEYLQTDLIGKTGVESSYENILRGRHGDRTYEVDAHNNITSKLGENAAEDGRDLELSIDIGLQKVAEDALKQEMDKSDLKRGAVVIMDPRDGSILALVSWPSYDDNIFSGTVSSTLYNELITNEERPLLPRAWAGMYPSGSAVKPVIATAALEEGVIKSDTTVLSTGGIYIGNSFFPDWKVGGHGRINVRSAIAWSVNTFFYYIGGGYDSFIGLGVDRLSAWFMKFGLGKKSGIDLPGESAGFVPSREWKENVKHERWYIGDTYNLSIGQGDLLVTPLQVAGFTSAVANGGELFVPHVSLNYVQDPNDETDLKINQTNLNVVRAGMRETVTYGSGRALASLSVPVAGKTGTAQWRNDKPNHAWFTCFAPYEKPEIVVTVLLEEGVEGSSVAVPVAKKILETWAMSYRK